VSEQVIRTILNKQVFQNLDLGNGEKDFWAQTSGE